MNINKLLILLCFLLIYSFSISECGSKASTGWSIFEKIQSVKPKSLSSTYYLPGDLSGILYNPSLLAKIERKELNLTTGFGYADERIAGVMYSFVYGSNLNMAAGVFNYDYGKMELCWIENDTIMERTVSAQSDYLGILGVGKRLKENMNAGVNLKVASSRIAEEATAYAFAFDGAITYFYRKKLATVLSVQNFGHTTKFINKAEKLPSSIMGGLSYFQNIASGYVLLGYTVPYIIEESRTTPEIGIEVGKWPFGLFTGYRTYADESALSYGLSLATEKYDFSYSYTPAQWLDNTHRMAFSIKLDSIEDIRNRIRLAYKAKAAEREEKRRQKELEKIKRQKEEELRLEKEKQEQLDKQLRLQKEFNEQIQKVISTSTFKKDFYIKDVVDSRETDVLGYISKDGVAAKSQMILEEGLWNFVVVYLGQYVKDGENKAPVVMDVQSLSISEDLMYINANARVKFYISCGDKRSKSRTFTSFYEKPVSEKNEDVYLNNVIYVLNDTIMQFANSDWEQYNDLSSMSNSIKEETKPLDRYTTRLGIGLGIPYGIMGGNFEINTGDVLSLTSSVGYSPGGAAYSFGCRLYAVPRNAKFRPCISLHYGVVAVLEKQIYSYSYYTYTQTTQTKYENINGTAFGVGYKYIKGNGSWDFDILYLSFKLPSYAEQQGGNVKISVGYGWHF